MCANVSCEMGHELFSGATGSEPSSKKRRFHPLRGLRRMFRRKPRTEPVSIPPESVPVGESVSGEPAGSSLLLPDGGGQPRSRSASELLGGSQELQAKRRSVLLLDMMSSWVSSRSNTSINISKCSQSVTASILIFILSSILVG
jgi:hypothetical protein